MPELPEVETIRRQLESVIVGQVISDVEVLNSGSFGGDSRQLIGLAVVGVRRRGKGLVLDLKGDRGLDGLSLVIHLKMTGQLIYESSGDGDEKRPINRLVGGHPTEDFVQKLPSKHTRVLIRFMNGEDLSTSSDGRGSPLSGESGSDNVLYFNDQRKFGWVKMVRTEDVEKLDFVSRLGREPWELSEDDFFRILQRTRKPVKVRLMDQDVIAGIGNIYANDGLWEARVDPRRSSCDLSRTEAGLLLCGVKMVLEEGILYGGATAPDKKYMDLAGLGGKYQEHFRVYEREGLACLRPGCRGVIMKTKVGGRGTYWCEECQN